MQRVCAQTRVEDLRVLRAASAPAMSMGDPVALQVPSGIILGVSPHVPVPFGIARHYPQHLNLSCALWMPVEAAMERWRLHGEERYG